MPEMNKAARSTTSGTASKEHSRRNHIKLAADGVELVVSPQEARVDSRLIAQQLRNQHKNVLALVKQHTAALRRFGLLPFQTEAVKVAGARGAKHQQFALLNEDQAFLLLSLSRNTDHVVQLKVALIAAFGEARRAAQQRAVEYLPTYHALHDAIAIKAVGSRNERYVHMNVNRLVNKVCGLAAGQRPAAPMAQQSMLTIAQAVAAKAMRSGNDHHDGYQRAKGALLALSSAVAIEGQRA